MDQAELHSNSSYIILRFREISLILIISLILNFLICEIEIIIIYSLLIMC